MKQFTLLYYLILSAFLPAILLGSSVEIPDQVSVAKDRLLLGDIARINGDPDALSEVSLGYAPYPGHHRWLTRSDVEHALSRAGLKNVRISM
ncbi:MAG TPA: hypothetical protein VKZ59_02035, partial [Acidobacteriota bacterium]|nr:hypothetical protein [Acidobacteriota bacterium]